MCETAFEKFLAARSGQVDLRVVVDERGGSQHSARLPFDHQLAGIVARRRRRCCSAQQYVQERDDWCLRMPCLMLSDWLVGVGKGAGVNPSAWG